MIKQSHPSMERLQRAADSARDLAVQMDDLLKLREAVANAEAALTRQKTEPPHYKISSATYRARTVVFEADAQARLHCANPRDVTISRSTTVQRSDLANCSIRNGAKGVRRLPGRLFMKSQWH